MLSDAFGDLNCPSPCMMSGAMRAFDVWVSSKRDVCRVRVGGLKNTLWLLDRLSQSFVFKTSEALQEDTSSSFFSFSVIHSFHMTQVRFERLLASIPQVRLMRVPVRTRA